MGEQPDFRPLGVRCITDRKSILRAIPMLEDAPNEWQQTGLARELYCHAGSWIKHPFLILFEDFESPYPSLKGAVFLYAYLYPILGKKLVSTADRVGRIGVFAHPAQRTMIAVAASRFLLETGTALIRITIASSRQADPQWHDIIPFLKNDGSGEEWSLKSKDLFFDLTLHHNLDDTLAQLGRRTRRNVRNVMRRSLADLGCVFLAQADVTFQEYKDINLRSARPVSLKTAKQRFLRSRDSCALFCGVRAKDGRLLCLLGGRISADTVIVEWQTNNLSFSSYSPGLLMRGFLMQHFGERGMQSLFFEGGTSHVMTRYFNKRTIYFLEARRSVLWLNLFTKFMTFFYPSKAITKILFGYG